jgi:hypothetical protein
LTLITALLPAFGLILSHMTFGRLPPLAINIKIEDNYSTFNQSMEYEFVEFLNQSKKFEIFVRVKKKFNTFKLNF